MKRLTLLLVFAVLLIGLVPVTAQDDNRIQVVASYSLLADVIQNVAGDAADVTSLIPVGADPHTYNPTPSDIATLVDADVVFVNGMNFEEGLTEAIENAGEDMNIVVASSCVEILPFGAGSHDHGDEDHDHEDGDDHGDEDHGDEDHDDEDHDREDGEEHGDEDHDHEDGEEHGDEDHGDEEHSDEMNDGSAIAVRCAEHHEEMGVLHDHDDEDHDHEDGEEHGDEDHDHEDGEEHEDEEHSDDEHGDEDHDHEDGEEHGDEDHDHEDGEEHDHDHSHGDRAEPLGMLYAIDCGEGHDHGDEDEEEHSEDEHEHGEGSCDPHVWMDPHNAIFWAMMARDTLIELDPANAETYTANAAAYIETLDALAHDFVRPSMDSVPEENRKLVTNHDAFGYLADYAGFEIVGLVIPSISTTAEPSAQDVANLIDTIRDEGVPAVFAETTVSTDIAEQVASEGGAEFFVLFTGSLSDEDGPASTYIDYIRYNVSTIATALGGEAVEG